MYQKVCRSVAGRVQRCIEDEEYSEHVEYIFIQIESYLINTKRTLFGRTLYIA